MGNHRRRRPSVEGQVKSRILICAVIAIAYGAYRFAPLIDGPHVVPPPPAVVPFNDVAAAAAKLTADDKAAMRVAYETLSRSIAADPAADPVFLDTAAVRRAHRAALLVVWKGLLDNKTGEVTGLREALEAAVNGRIGAADVPLNPSLKAEAAKAFADIAASMR